MPYSLAIFWHDRQRFLPAVLAVAFSALLMALQCGLLLGIFSITSLPVDSTSADLWLGGPGILSVDQGTPIPATYLASLARQPEVEQCEIYLKGLASWVKPDAHGSELCMVIGTRLAGDALGAVRKIDPTTRYLLTEPGAVVVDKTELGRLGIGGVGDRAEINGQRVRVVALVEGLQSIAAPYIYCSTETARVLLRLPADQTTYVLARCHDSASAAAVAERLRSNPNVSVFTADDLSWRTRLHWMMKTKAGIALGFAAALGLLVGAVVTSQTLYAATAGSLREYAVLRALGIPRWRMCASVLAQSLWVGVLGIGIGVPTVYTLAQGAAGLGAKVLLSPWLVAAAGFVTLVMAMLSGLVALRSLRLAEPATLLR
jgi:putative ABC transport system permease protein